MLNIKKMEKCALAFFALLSALFLLSLFLSPERKYREKIVETALFSSDNISCVRKIVLKDSSSFLSIEKEGEDFFVVLPSGERLIAENEFVGSFLSNLSKKRDVIVVSEKKSSWSGTGVGDNGLFSLSIDFGEGKSASIFFGDGFDGAGNVFFRSSSSPFVYQCGNDFASYLKTDLSFWTSKPLFSTVGKVNEGDLQSVSMGEKLLSGERLKDAEHALLALSRGLVVISAVDEAAEKVRVRASFLGGRETLLTFFSADNHYVVRSDVFLHGEKKASYCFSVSEWTFSELSSIFS